MKNTKISFKKKLTFLIIGIIACLLSITASVLVFVLNKEEDDTIINPPSTVAGETGAREAEESVKGGFLYLAPGAKYVMTGGSLTGGDNVYGGAVYVSRGATFIMNGGTISNCTALYAGAIYVEEGGYCEINGGVISKNASQKGPAVYAEDDTNLIIKQTGDDIPRITENYYSKYSIVINVYVGNTLLTSYEDEDRILDIATASSNGASWEDNVGYFLDSELTSPLDIGTRLKVENVESTQSEFTSQNPIKTATIPTKQLDVYTKTITDEDKAKLIFTDISDTTCSVGALNNTISGVVNIPAMYNGKYVTEVTGGTSDTLTTTGFDDCSQVTSVYLPSTVNIINSYAFYKCTSLNSVSIYAVESLGNYAFNSCVALTEITFPSCLKNVSGYAFGNCTNLLKIHVSSVKDLLEIQAGSIPPDAISWNLNSEFEYCIDGVCITDIVLPEGITSIGMAFSSYKKLKSITFPNNLSNMTTYAFYGCSGVERINIKSIESFIRLNTNSYTNSIFSHATNAKLYIEGEDLPLTDIVLPEGVTTLFPNFAYYNELTSITLPKSLTSIMSGALYNCSELTELILPYGLKNIESYAFYGCAGLTSITIPDSVITLGGSVFARCSNLSEVDISNNIDTINSQLFYYCTSLTEIYIPSSVKTINASSYSLSPFYNCSSGLKIYCESATDGGFGKYWRYYSSSGLLTAYYKVSKEQYYRVQETGFFIQNGSLYEYFGTETEVIVPRDVTYISDAFSGNKNITSVTIPNSVTGIGSYAFSNCTGIEYMQIPSSVRYIDMDCFVGCTGLRAVEFLGDDTTIGSFAFSGCTSLENINLPKNTKTIPSYAFYGCTSLKSIKIPSSVTNIYVNAFASCTGLEKIYIPSSVTTIETYGDFTYSPFYNCSPELKIYLQSVPISGWGTYWNNYSEMGTIEYIENVLESDYDSLLANSQSFTFAYEKANGLNEYNFKGFDIISNVIGL